ncbi:alpha/beta hydrolase [soil metagenome]
MTLRKFAMCAALGTAGTSMILACVPATAGQLRERLRERMAERMAQPPVAGLTEYAYGSDPLQKLDFWRPANTVAPVPLVLFVHGGGWKRGDKRNATGTAKVEHMLAQGYAFASINYRLVPTATVEEQAADVAASLAWVRSNAARLGVDPRRIVLMGHSAGAHLVSLAGTDPKYLAEAKLSFADLRGVIALDGACYDVPRQIAEGGNFMHDTYVQAFGSDPVRQRALSPTFHADTPNAPAFLIAHIDRTDGTAQSEALGAALAKAGTETEVRGFAGKGLQGHAEINRSLGDVKYPATAVVDAWLAKAFARK